MLKVSSIAVFNSDGKLLFGKRADSGKWTLPGGKAEEGESPEATAERELFEEAGIRAEHMGYLGCGTPGPGLIVHAFKAVVDDVKPSGENDPDKEVDYWSWKWVDVTDGIPAEILDNLHAPKNVVLGLLGYQQRQPEPEMSHEESQENSADLDEEVELSKSEGGLQLTEELRLHDHLLPPAFRGAHLVSQTRGCQRVVRLMKSGECVAELSGRLGDAHGYPQAQHVDDGWRGRGVPTVLRRAFMDMAKAEDEPGKPSPELQRLWAAFWGPVGGKPDLQALKEAPTIPPRLWAEALGSAAMRKRPQAVATLLSRPDVESDYLGRAAASVAAQRDFGQPGFTIADKKARAPILRALATNPRLPSTAAPSVHSALQQNYSENFADDDADLKAGAALLSRRDIEPEAWARMAHQETHNEGSEPIRQGLEDPARAAAMRKRLLASYSGIDLKKFPQLRFDPEEVKNLFASGTAAIDSPRAARLHVFEHQPDAVPDAALRQLWGASEHEDFHWGPEHVKRLQPQEVVDQLKKISPYTWRGYAGIQHPGLSEAQVKDVVDDWGEVPADAIKAPNISPEYRRELWQKMGPLQQREGLASAPPELVADYLRHADRDEIKEGFREISKNKAIMADPNFWPEHLQAGSGYSSAAMSYPELLAQLSHLPNPTAAALLPHLTNTGAKALRNGMDWNRAHEDLVRGMHAAQQRTKPGFEDATNFGATGYGTTKSKEAYEGRLMEMGLAEPQRLRVQLGTTKLRQLRALVEEQGGAVNDKELKARGINLGSQGMGRLLDSKGNLTTAAIDQHGQSLPASEWAFTHGTWEGLQRHSRAKQKVFQLNLTPERRRELDAQGLGPVFDAMQHHGAGHPSNGRHGVGWVRYSETPGGIHIDEIQSDLSHNLVQRLKERPEAASAQGVAPEHMATLVHQVWGDRHPSEVIHEAFLQHLRDAGKQGTEVQHWQLQLQPKMKLSGQDLKKQPPAHMRETYEKQPKKMGYEPSTYGGLRAQSNSKLTGKPTWSQILKREDDGWDAMRVNLARNHVTQADVDMLGDHSHPVPADVQAKVLGLDWDGWVAPVAALIRRPDVPRASWQPRFDAMLQERQPSDFMELFLGGEGTVKALTPEQSQAALDYCLHEGFTPKALLRHGKLSEESLVQVAKRSSTLSSIEAAMNNPHLSKDGRGRIWKDVDPSDKPDLASKVPLEAKDFDEAMREPVGHAGIAKLIQGAAEQPSVGHEDWKRWLQPEGVLHGPLSEEPRLLNAMPETVLGDDQLAQHLLPAMRAYSQQEDEMIHDGQSRGWFDAVSDATLHRLAEEKGLPTVSGNERWDTRLYKLGLRDSEHVEVRPGLNKLRKLRDLIDARGGVVSPKDLGINLSAQGLGNLLDKQGMLTSNSLQAHIDSQPALRYSMSHGDWDGPQRHSGEASQVFQLNLSRDGIHEMERQGLDGVYRGLANGFHPQHQGHGIGWVRYTEKPDGVHIDEIQTDFGHALGQRIKRQNSSGLNSISADQYERLSHLMWRGRHPSEVLHEAFLQHLRDRGDKTGAQGKEVHLWQLQPKMILSGQDTQKPAPVHMKQTYDEQPKKMGYEPDVYGTLGTQAGKAVRGGPDAATVFKPQGAPTWSQRLSKAFELDALAYLADNGDMLLNKSLGKKLMGLAAATALHVMPTGLDDKGNVPHPAEEQRVKDVFGTAPMTGADQQTMAVATAPRQWSAKGLDDELHPIAHLESSFGQNMNHVPNKTDWNTAFGALGMKPMTAHFEYKKSRVLQRLYPGLDHEDIFSHRFKADPQFYNAVANSHFGWLKRQLGGDAEKAALAWRYGLGAVQQAPDLAALDQEGYGTKYRAIAARRVAHRVATAPAAFRAAIDSVLDKGEA